MANQKLKLQTDVSFNVEWNQLIGKFNWYDFTIIKVYFQNDKLFGMFNVELGLFGFVLYFSYDYSDTNEKQSLNAQIAELGLGETTDGDTDNKI